MGRQKNPGGGTVLQASVTKTSTFVGTAVPGFAGFRELIITLDVTAADRADANETYDVYVYGTDGVATWDLVHFPQIITTGAKRFVAKVVGPILPQNVTTAAPGVAAVESGTLAVGAGQANVVKTLAAGLVRHGPFPDQINHEVVIAGTTPSITYSITVTAK